MELPANSTQIGELDPHCKIYIEDYVFSYIKQMSGQTGADKALALYGTKKTEGDTVFLFLYGAAPLLFLTKETKHLSQAVLQDAEKQRKKYFPEYVFLAYQLLGEELPDGFYVYEQGIGRFTAGYLRFFEKNDAMLNFLLAERGSSQPENTDQEKYETVRQRQEQRKQEFAETEEPQNKSESAEKKIPGNKNGRVLIPAAACVLLLTSAVYLKGPASGFDTLKQKVNTSWAAVTRQYLPTEEAPVKDKQAGTIVAADKLAEAILKENEDVAVSAGKVVAESEDPSREEIIVPGAAEPKNEEAKEAEPKIEESIIAESKNDEPETVEPSAETLQTAENPDKSAEVSSEKAVEDAEKPESESLVKSTEADETEEVPASVKPAENYLVQKGDTLLAICFRKYGTGTRVNEICELNNIKNPDDIKFGTKILLP